MKALVTCPHCQQQHEVEPAKLLGHAKKGKPVSDAVKAANKARAINRWHPKGAK